MVKNFVYFTGYLDAMKDILDLLKEKEVSQLVVILDVGQKMVTDLPTIVIKKFIKMTTFLIVLTICRYSTA